MKNIFLGFAAVAAFLLTVAMLFTAGWVHPPILSSQVGFRGLAQDQLHTPAEVKLLKVANKLPDPIDPAEPTTDKAKDVYQNVQVLGDLTVNQFNRVMLGMSAWVAPADQSCNYCHGENMVSDDIYAKRVARQMLIMVRDINKNWTSHVAQTGVVCYTCHRGAPVPKYTWSREKLRRAPAVLRQATRAWGIRLSPTVRRRCRAIPTPIRCSGTGPVRVQAKQALPVGYGAPIQATERTYSLMIAMTKSLGVNCNFCHNSRSFTNWEESQPQRVTAWYGLQMARHLNNEYLEPLKTELPATRLGPLGDAPKVNCFTCHQGANKPSAGREHCKRLAGAGRGAGKLRQLKSA